MENEDKKWHLSSDELPPMGVEVIVQDENGNFAVAFFDGGWNSANCLIETDRIIAWCEIPGEDYDYDGE